MLVTKIRFAKIDKTSFQRLVNRTQDNSSRHGIDNFFKGVTFVLEMKRLFQMPGVVSIGK